jgi:hypothetical protein
VTTTANGIGNGGTGRFNGGTGPNGSFAPGAGGFGGGNGAGRGLGFAGAGGLSITGTVDTISDDSVTIKTSTGNTVTIGLDSSTTYHQQADATSSDVTAGTTVILQVGAGGFRGGNGGANASPGTGNGSANGGNSLTLGTASDVTVVP